MIGWGAVRPRPSQAWPPSCGCSDGELWLHAETLVAAVSGAVVLCQLAEGRGARAGHHGAAAAAVPARDRAAAMTVMLRVAVITGARRVIREMMRS